MKLLLHPAARFQAIAKEYRRNQIAIQFLDNTPYISYETASKRVQKMRNLAITREQILAAEAKTKPIYKAVFIFAALTSTVVWQLFLVSALVAVFCIGLASPIIWRNSIYFTGPVVLGLVITILIGQIAIGW